jgi:hypothetical protein
MPLCVITFRAEWLPPLACWSARCLSRRFNHRELVLPDRQLRRAWQHHHADAGPLRPPHPWPWVQRGSDPWRHNDILLGIDPGTTIQNLHKLAERTIQQHAEPVLCEVPPIHHSYNHADMRNYRPQVLELNSRIIQLAATHHGRLVDYYTPLDSHPSYSSDGVHMKRRGYLVMEETVLRQLPSN